MISLGWLCVQIWLKPFLNKCTRIDIQSITGVWVTTVKMIFRWGKNGWRSYFPMIFNLKGKNAETLYNYLVKTTTLAISWPDRIWCYLLIHIQKTMQIMFCIPTLATQVAFIFVRGLHSIIYSGAKRTPDQCCHYCTIDWRRISIQS